MERKIPGIGIFMSGFVIGAAFMFAVNYYSCRKTAFQRYCDRNFFGSQPIEWLNTNKNDGVNP